MPKGNPNIRDIAGRGRNKRTDEKFFLKVNDNLRVTRDTYNIIIAEIFIAADSGRCYQVNKGFYSTMEGVYQGLRVIHGLEESAIKAFQDRTDKIVSTYIIGKMKLEEPEDFIYDEHDVLSDPNTTPDDKEDTGDDEESNDPE
jgi:hypothetical protein